MKKKFLLFKDKLYNNSINKRHLFDHLKISYSFEEQEYIIKQIPKAYNSLIYGTPIFKSPNDFGLRKLGNAVFFETEMNWLVHLFKKYSKEIDAFVQKKSQYETSFLLGNYTESRGLINQIKEISYSYWGLENRFLQTQYEEGLEFNFKLLNKSTAQEINDPAFYFLAHFFSFKVEEDSSYFSYINALENSVNWGISEDYKNYFFYRLNSISHNYRNIESLLWASSNLSIIDKYILFKDIIANSLSNPEINISNDFIKKHSFYLGNHLNDTFFKKANFLISNVNYLSDEHSEEEILLIDFFSKGDYENVIAFSNVYFKKNINFYIIEIYVKSHLHLLRDLKTIGNEKSLLNVLIRLMHKILLRDSISNDAILELLTIANALSSFDISKEIISFISYHFNKEERVQNKIVSFLYSKNYNPLYFEIFSSHDLKDRYLNSIKTKNLVTVKFFQQILNNKVHDLNEIPVYRLSFYVGKNYFKNKKYELCVAEITKTLTHVQDVAYLREQCLKTLYLSYVELEEYDAAVDLYVNNFISNPQIVSKINAAHLSEIIVKNKWKKILHFNINFPIFIYLAHSETHAKYIAYDIFMRTQNIDRPTSLSELDGIETKNKVFFLKNVASQKIISRKAIIFKNSTEVLKERISICQILAKIDQYNSEEYNKEISDITQRLTVQQRIKEIDESKIYIDEVGIYEKELAGVQKGFNRFKNISQLLKENNIDATGIGYDALYDLLEGRIDTDAYKKSLRKTDIHFELFTQLFIDIRDKFLFSNQYGLDYYLSQRIRHGTIINQLRKSFNTNNLITTKSSKGDDYLPNEYWLTLLNIDESLKKKLKDRLNIFSSNTDTIISNLKNKFIQIKTEDPKTNQSGWFDYTYVPLWDSSWLYSLFLAELQFFTNFEDFVKSIYDILWLITDRNLTVIRKKIVTEVKKELIDEIDKLEVDLKKILVNKSAGALFRSIAECRTNIQADIDYVITWFNKSKNNEIDFTFEDALNTSHQIVNNIISPNVLIIHIENKAEKCSIKGQYFTHFVDLIKIFLTNIYDYYSKTDITNKKTSIEATQEGEKLILKMSNSLKEGEDIDNLKSIIALKLADSEKHIKGIRGEGSTGFPKAKNILKNVFRDNNELKFEINEEVFVVKCEIFLKNLIV